MSRGHTLVELTAVLGLLAVAASALAPAARAYRDRSAVVAAREAVAGLVTEARVRAIESGGASVHVAARPWRAWVQVGDSGGASVALERELGVALDLGGERDATELPFDALGLGRVASETIVFRRGDAEAALVISGYGRVRRR